MGVVRIKEKEHDSACCCRKRREYPRGWRCASGRLERRRNLRAVTALRLATALHQLKALLTSGLAKTTKDQMPIGSPIRQQPTQGSIATMLAVIANP